MIPFARPLESWRKLREPLSQAFFRVMDSGLYIQGPEVLAFESEFAAQMGSPHGVGVASGTDAITLSLKALGIARGDEVICPSHTAVATVAAIELSGATPVLADIEESTMTLDMASAAAAIGPRTRALVAVHLYGQCASLDSLSDLCQTHQIHLIEDCAQAHGAEFQNRAVGSLGATGCFSFYPTKNLGAFGDGGAVLTGRPEIAQRLRELREYGWRDRYHSAIPGANNRLDELQAAFLRVKLPFLAEVTAERVRLAGVYHRELSGLPLTLPVSRQGCSHVFHLYVLRTPKRNELLNHLRANEIGATLHYPLPVHLQDAYRGRLTGGRALPITEKVCEEIITLPLFPGLTSQEQERVVHHIKGFFK